MSHNCYYMECNNVINKRSSKDTNEIYIYIKIINIKTNK